MVNASNGYAGTEPDFAAPVAYSPQIRAWLGTTRALRQQPLAQSRERPREGLALRAPCLSVNPLRQKIRSGINDLH
jgi:hypothetical protein